jgi:hypothetical protein
MAIETALAAETGYSIQVCDEQPRACVTPYILLGHGTGLSVRKLSRHASDDATVTVLGVPTALIIARHHTRACSTLFEIRHLIL